jgi:hypothetical protein
MKYPLPTIRDLSRILPISSILANPQKSDCYRTLFVLRNRIEGSTDCCTSSTGISRAFGIYASL